MNKEFKKRNWVIRTIDIFHNLKLNVIYNAPDVRNLLRENFSDSISIPTMSDLLSNIIIAQEKGMQFVINNKVRKMVEKETISKNKLYELIEI